MASFSITLFGILLGSAGVIVSIYYGRRALAAERARVFYGWTQLETAARTLARRIQESFKPDVLVAVDGGGCVFAALLAFELGERLIIRVAHVYPKDFFVSAPETILTQSCIEKQTSKFRIFVPKYLVPSERGTTKTYRVLVVDDAAITGHRLAAVRKLVEEAGVHCANIRTACVVCCRTAIDSQNSPDFEWATIPSDEVFFPWGSGHLLKRAGQRREDYSDTLIAKIASMDD